MAACLRGPGRQRAALARVLIVAIGVLLAAAMRPQSAYAAPFCLTEPQPTPPNCDAIWSGNTYGIIQATNEFPENGDIITVTATVLFPAQKFTFVEGNRCLPSGPSSIQIFVPGEIISVSPGNTPDDPVTIGNGSARIDGGPEDNVADPTFPARCSDAIPTSRFAPGTSFSVTFKYTALGRATARAIFSGNAGFLAWSDSAIWYFHYRNQPPKADFDINRFAAGEFQFDATPSEDPEGDDLTYEWDFDDGTTDEGIAVLKSYEKPGSYNVTLTVTDSEGNVDSITKTVEVPAPELKLMLNFPGFPDAPPPVVEGEKFSARLIVSASDGVGPLSNLTFQGDPLRAEPDGAARISGPMPSVPNPFLLQPGEAVSFDFEVEFLAGEVEVTLRSNLSGQDAAGNSVEAEAGRELRPAPSLTVQVAATPPEINLNEVEPGETPIVEFKVTVTNVSDEVIENAFAPADLDLLDASGAGGLSQLTKESGPLPSDSLGPIAPGASKAVTYTYAVHGRAHLIVRATVNYEPPGGGSARGATGETTFKAVQSDAELTGSITLRYRYQGEDVEETLNSDNGELKGEFIAGDVLKFKGRGWDPEGGAVSVMINGEPVGQYQPDEFEDELELPAFVLTKVRADACVHVLEAVQGTLKAELKVRGEAMAAVMLVQGGAAVDGKPANTGDIICEGSHPGSEGDGVLLAQAIENPQAREFRFPHWLGLWLTVRRSAVSVDIEGGLLTSGIYIPSPDGSPGLAIPISLRGGLRSPPGQIHSAGNEAVFDCQEDAPAILVQANSAVVSASARGLPICLMDTLAFRGMADPCEVDDPLGPGNTTPHFTLPGSLVVRESASGHGQIIANLTAWFLRHAALQPCSGLSTQAGTLVVGPIPGFTLLGSGAQDGASALAVMSNEGFNVGDEVVIGRGTAAEERAVVSGLGSLILDRQLIFDHPAGTAVINLTRPPKDLEFRSFDEQPGIGYYPPPPAEDETSAPPALSAANATPVELVAEVASLAPPRTGDGGLVTERNHLRHHAALAAVLTAVFALALWSFYRVLERPPEAGPRGGTCP